MRTGIVECERIADGSTGAAISGTIWQVIVFITGLLPTVLAVTGVMIWLRRRRIRRSGADRAAGVPQLDAAE
jgi:uncharacterized iron-regulated membrane protein